MEQPIYKMKEVLDAEIGLSRDILLFNDRIDLIYRDGTWLFKSPPRLEQIFFTRVVSIKFESSSSLLLTFVDNNDIRFQIDWLTLNPFVEHIAKLHSNITIDRGDQELLLSKREIHFSKVFLAAVLIIILPLIIYLLTLRK